MNVRGSIQAGAVVLAMLLWSACGQVYRPVVIPCSAGSGVPGCPVVTSPSPSNFHSVFGISNNVPNGISPNVASYPGGAMQIDVSGDSIIAETSLNATGEPNTGLNPTHIALLSNDTKVFVASASSAFSGGLDVVASFSPVFQSSTGSTFGQVSTIALPSQTVNITSISESGNVVTATLAGPLLANPSNSGSGPIAAGTAIVIAGVLIPGCSSPCNPLLYNGSYIPTSISNGGATITFTSANTGLAAASGGTASVPPQPVFLNSAQSTAMYVANFNSNSVSEINTASNIVINSAAVGTNPVSLAETPSVTNNGAPKLYVANQGSASVGGSISSLNVTDLSSNTLTGFSGVNPVWMVARGDSQKVYAITQGDGTLTTIDTATDTATTPDCTATPTLCVGAGANFIFYDSHLNRLYVTNPATGLVYVFSDTGGPNDTPLALTPGGLAIPGLPATGTFSCSTCSAPVPVSVTASPNGVGFYVASYQTAPAPCPDPNVSGACVIPELVAFDATSLTATTSAMTLLTWAPAGSTPGPFATNQYAVAPVASCVPASLTALYSPTTTRFRVFTATAPDSSSVYVSSCDAGIIAAINTTDNNPNGATGTDIPVNTLITDLPAPFSNGTTQANGEPPNQNPLFLLTGQ